MDIVVQHCLWAEPASSTHLLDCGAGSFGICTSSCMLTPPSTPTPAPHVSRTAGPMASVGIGNHPAGHKKTHSHKSDCTRYHAVLRLCHICPEPKLSFSQVEYLDDKRSVLTSQCIPKPLSRPALVHNAAHHRTHKFGHATVQQLDLLTQHNMFSSVFGTSFLGGGEWNAEPKLHDRA